MSVSHYRAPMEQVLRVFGSYATIHHTTLHAFTHTVFPLGYWPLVSTALKLKFGFETVPALYQGPFSVVVMQEHTDGKTTMTGGHIREGIVMMPVVERIDPLIGRVCLKSISADYLLRKGGTEYN